MYPSTQCSSSLIGPTQCMLADRHSPNGERAVPQEPKLNRYIICQIEYITYVCVSVATHSDHDFLACGGKVPNILMRVALNHSQLPFVCGLYGMVCNFVLQPSHTIL